ncbi:hypothetical protein, partial [Enterobacter mori]|uniref:hypothetical protein n=1 Tax=Enterobacter mori TaxID=539813 RepID=UPI0021C95335
MGVTKPAFVTHIWENPDWLYCFCFAAVCHLYLRQSFTHKGMADMLPATLNVMEGKPMTTPTFDTIEA